MRMSSVLQLFQSATGSAHWPSILAALGWLAGSAVAGFFLMINLVVNRADRVATYEREIAVRSQSATAGRLTVMAPNAGVWPKIEIGDSGTVFEYTRAADFPFITIGDTALKIENVDGVIKVSVRLIDREGKLVGELIRNEWKFNPTRYFDRNYSPDTVEVRDLEGDVVLQVRVLPDRVQLQCVLFSTDGRGVELRKRKSRGIGGQIAASVLGPLSKGRKPLGKITPLFKYPSDLHPGEYDDPNRSLDLPDGRTKSGSVISGKPIHLAECQAAILARVGAEDWPGAYSLAGNYVEMVEEAIAAEIDATGELYIGNYRVQPVFSLAAFCAFRANKMTAARTWIEIALNAHDLPSDRGLFLAILISQQDSALSEKILAEGLKKEADYVSEFRTALTQIHPSTDDERKFMQYLYSKMGISIPH